MNFQRWGAFTLVFLAALAASIVWIAYGQQHELLWLQWIIICLILIGYCMFAGHLVAGRIDGILIDDRNRISLERFQWVAWLIVLFGGYFAETAFNIGASVPNPFPNLQPQLLVLLGIVSASPVVSNVITDSKKQTPPLKGPQTVQPLAAGDAPIQTGSIDVNRTVEEASWKDLYLGEEVANRYVVDIGRLQKLIITVLLVVTYLGLLWHDLKNPGSKFSDMPKVSDDDKQGSFIWLLGISHAAYLAYKGTPKTPS